MRVQMLVFLVLFGVCEAGEADPKAPPLPPDVQRVLSNYDKAVAEAQKVFDKAEGKARDDATKALEKAKVDATKKGDLDTANQVLAAIKKLNEGKASADPLGEVQKTEFPVGHWQRTDNPDQFFDLDANGTWTSCWNFSGTWSIEKKQIIFVADKGNTQTFSVSLTKESNWKWSNGPGNGAAIAPMKWVGKAAK